MIIFKHQCLLGDYEAALESVRKQPDDNFKLNSLRKLLSDLADKRLAKTIVQLQYAALENDVGWAQRCLCEIIVSKGSYVATY